MMMKILLSVSAAALALAGVASAAGFSDMDENADGLITREEFSAAFPDTGDDVWMAADTNGDGGLTEDEFQAARDSGVLPES